MADLLSALVGDAAIEAFFRDDAEIAALCRVEAALAEASAEAGLIPDEAAARIAEVCAAFRPDMPRLSAGLAKDGVVAPDLVRQLRAAVGETHAHYLHRGATSQDIVDTGLMLRLKSVAAVLDRRLEGLLDDLAALRARDGASVYMAHTRMQVALPIAVADKIETWAAPLRRHRLRLEAASFPVQLGGPVGTGGGFEGKGPDIAAALARRLGLSPAEAWHSGRDRVADIAHLFSLISGSLGKIGQDVALMVQNEVGAARLAGGGGSSAMAHKVNPVGAEVLVSLARFNAGLGGTLGQALVHENERSGAAWTLEWMVLPQMAVAAGASLRIAASLIAGLIFPTGGKPG